MAKNTLIIDRSVVKHNGVVLYTLQSGSDATKKYFVTVTNGVIDRETHMDCDGYRFVGHCYHSACIERIEADLSAAEAELKAQEQSSLATYDVQAAATQVLADCEIGDAYEQVEYVPVAERVVEEYKPNGLAETYDASWYRKSSNR